MAAAAAILEPAAPAAELAVVPAPPMRLTLYALEESLTAYADTVEMVEPEQEQEFLAQFQQVMMATADKRDGVNHFMGQIQSTADFADAEIARLQERKAWCLKVLDRLTTYVTGIIKSKGQDAKGKYPKLEGRVTSFQIKKCPPSVEITDEGTVPATYKSVTITLPLPLYDELLDSLDLDFAGKIADAVKNAKVYVNKTPIKEDLAKGEVPGARLVDDKYRLERK